MDCVTNEYVTLEYQECCVALSADENVCRNFSTRHLQLFILTVPFGVLWACLDRQQSSRVPNESLYSLFSELAIQIKYSNIFGI